jgi:hypothetical protein
MILGECDITAAHSGAIAVLNTCHTSVKAI